VDFHAYDITSIIVRSFFELESKREYKALDSAELRKGRKQQIKILIKMWRKNA
jgi:hypothetical protein